MAGQWERKWEAVYTSLVKRSDVYSLGTSLLQGVREVTGFRRYKFECCMDSRDNRS